MGTGDQLFLGGAGEEEGGLVGGDEVALGFGGAHAVAGVVVDAQEDGVFAGGGGLEAGGHFEELPRVDAGVVGAGDEEDGGVGGAVLDVLVGVHGLKGLEAVGVLDGAEFGGVDGAVGAGFHAQGVFDADVDDAEGEEVGALGERAADGDAAGAGAASGEFGGRGVAFVDEVLGAGDEVADGVLLGEFLAGEMPVLSVFAATADVGVGDDDALFEQGEAGGVEVGVEADAVGTVAFHEAGVLAVELEVFAVDDGEGDGGAVGGGGGDFDGGDVGEVGGVEGLEVGVGNGVGGGVVVVPLGGFGPAGEADERAGVIDVGGEAFNGTGEWKGDFGDAVSGRRGCGGYG